MSSSKDDVPSVHDFQKNGNMGMAFAKYVKGFCISSVLIGTAVLAGTLSGLGKLAVKTFDSLAEKLERKRVINDKTNTKPLLTRYYLLSTNRPSWLPFNVFLNRFTNSDTGDLHDHPWDHFIIIIWGGYTERIYIDDDKKEVIDIPRTQGFFQVVPATQEQCILINKQNGDCWCLCIPFRRVREWGFLKKKPNTTPVWVTNEKYLSARRSEYLSKLSNLEDVGNSDEDKKTLRQRISSRYNQVRHRSRSVSPDPLAMSLE
jgi:hypothetical protein